MASDQFRTADSRHQLHRPESPATTDAAVGSASSCPRERKSSDLAAANADESRQALARNQAASGDNSESVSQSDRQSATSSRRRFKSQSSIVSFGSSSQKQQLRSSDHHENDKFLKRFAVNNDDVSEDNIKYHRLCFGILAGTFVIDPARSFHYRWLSVISLAVCYNIVFIIGRGTFWGLHNLYPRTWYLLDYLCDAVYLVDMLANSRTGYLEQGILVRNTRKLVQHYIRSYAFKLDLISVLPTDLAYAFMAARCSPNRVPCPIIVRLNRLLRFHRLARFFDRTESATNFPFVFRISKLLFYILVIIHWNACLYFAISYAIGFGSDHWVYQPLQAASARAQLTSGPSDYSSAFASLQQLTSATQKPAKEQQQQQPTTEAPNSALQTVISTTTELYLQQQATTRILQPYERQLVQHDNARMQHHQQQQQQQHQSNLANASQANPYGFNNTTSNDNQTSLGSSSSSNADIDNDSLVHQYVYCFYWSTLTLTTIGEVPMPERDEEYLFVVIDFLIGLLIFATIVGNIGSMITNMNAARADFQHKMDSVKQWMKFRKVNKELEDRIIKWFDYLWANRQTLDEDAVTAILPDRLKAETAIHVHLETLKRVQLFQDCEPGLLVQLVLKLKLQVFSPGDYICRVGDVGKEMYIVKRGELSVLAEDCKTVYGKLSDGSVFGELSILNISGVKTGNRRTANVRSVGYSDLFALSKQDLWNVLEDYPDAKELLVERGKQILRKDGLLHDDVSKADGDETDARADNRQQAENRDEADHEEVSRDEMAGRRRAAESRSLGPTGAAPTASCCCATFGLAAAATGQSKFQKARTPSLFGLAGDANQADAISDSSLSMTPSFQNNFSSQTHQQRARSACCNSSFRQRLHTNRDSNAFLSIVTEGVQGGQQLTNESGKPILKRRPIMKKSLSFAIDHNCRPITADTMRFGRYTTCRQAQKHPPSEAADMQYQTAAMDYILSRNNGVGNNFEQFDLSVSANSLQPADMNDQPVSNLCSLFDNKQRRGHKQTDVTSSMRLESARELETLRESLIENVLVMTDKFSELCRETKQIQTEIHQGLSRLESVLVSNAPTDFAAIEQPRQQMTDSEGAVVSSSNTLSLLRATSASRLEHERLQSAFLEAERQVNAASKEVVFLDRCQPNMLEANPDRIHFDGRNNHAPFLADLPPGSAMPICDTSPENSPVKVDQNRKRADRSTGDSEYLRSENPNCDLESGKRSCLSRKNSDVRQHN